MPCLLLCIRRRDWDDELRQVWTPHPGKEKVGVVELAALDVPLSALWVLSLPTPVILGMRRDDEEVARTRTKSTEFSEV